MKYTVTINPHQIGQAWLSRHGAVEWDWEASRDNIIEVANQIANASPDDVEVELNTVLMADQTSLAVTPKEGEGLRIYEELVKYYRSDAWIAKPKPSPFAEIPTEGEDLKAYEWALKYWSDARFDWPYHADFYRDNYRRSQEVQAKALQFEQSKFTQDRTKMLTALAFERNKAQIHCARLRRDAHNYRQAKQPELADKIAEIAETYYQDQIRLTNALTSFEYNYQLDERQVRIAIDMIDNDAKARGWAKEAIRNGALGQGPCKTVREAGMTDGVAKTIQDTVNALIEQAIFGKRFW